MSNKNKKYLVSTESDGFETVIDGDGVVIVPVETIGEDRQKLLADGEYEKLLKHGVEFPFIYLTEILEILEETGKLEEILEQCRLRRQRLDGLDDVPEQ